MKKNKNITPRQIALALLSIIALVIVLPSCAHFHDEPTKSVWAGGLWIVFWLPFLGSLLALYVSYGASRSGSSKQVDLGTPNAHTEYSKENVPIYKVAQFKYFVVLQIIAWIICIAVNRSA
jgi:hypothetical protein